jgi:hypothetical protein
LPLEWRKALRPIDDAKLIIEKADEVALGNRSRHAQAVRREIQPIPKAKIAERSGKPRRSYG